MVGHGIVPRWEPSPEVKGLEHVAVAVGLLRRHLVRPLLPWQTAPELSTAATRRRPSSRAAAPTGHPDRCDDNSRRSPPPVRFRGRPGSSIGPRRTRSLKPLLFIAAHTPSKDWGKLFHNAAAAAC